MSSQKTTTSQGKKTAFCNACFKAGKDESVYTNHFPKSSAGPNGVVVCPTILAASCNYCRKTGHWANEKFCPAMKRDIREKEKEARMPIAPGLPDNQSNNQNKGRFAVLSVDDDSDDDEQLIGKKRERDVPLPKAGVSWASMASQEPTPKPDKSVTIYVSQKVNKPTELTAKEKEAFKILAERKRENIKTWDWAADSDAEDEEEEPECTSAW